jgi:leucyl aminopeptidase
MALGEDMGALFATDDALAGSLLAASTETGEPFWQLPLVDGYEPQLESDVADLKNLGKPGNAGAIVAALFLRHFTNGVAWAHLDVAGPSRADSARGYYQRGATAFGARTLLQYLITRSRQS